MDGAILKAFIKSKQLNKTELAADLGMSKQNLYQLFKTKAFEVDTINTIERKFRVKWEKIKAEVNIDVSRDTTRPQVPQKDGNGAKQDYLSGKNLENFSEAQRKLSETNSQLATAIVHAQSGSRQDHGLVPSLVDLIQEIAGGKKQVPIDELLTQLRKALVRDNGYR